MEFYVKFSFWLNLIGFVIYLVELLAKEFPYNKKITIGYKAASVIISLGFVVWSAILLCGLK